MIPGKRTNARFFSICIFAAMASTGIHPIGANAQRPAAGDNLQYIIFGHYCGECMHDCAIMFRYDISKGKGTLWVDHTESFFRNHGNVACQTPVSDSIGIKIAAEITRNIPAAFCDTADSARRWGCPGCVDGCGIYFEIKKDGHIIKHYIDSDPSHLSGRVKPFSQYLEMKIRQMLQRKL